MNNCRIGLAQVGYPTDSDVLTQVSDIARAAKESGVELLVFPEALTVSDNASAADVQASSEPLNGRFVQGLCEIAVSSSLWVVATLFEENPEGRPFNTAVVVNSAGDVRGAYRKCHLYDAHGTLESERMGTGSQLFAAIDTPFGKLGLGICYDLRFPEVVRTAALAGCELFVLPAAWHAGPHKEDHWQTLLKARAIENELFVAAACRAGERYVECSMVVDPLGVTVDADTVAVPGGELLCCDVRLSDVADARDAMPIFEHRRPELYA